MDWPQDFYAKQGEWSGCYTGLPEQGDHHRAEVVSDALAGRPSRILELGAGGGQSACATAQRGHDVTAVELVARSAVHARSLASHAAPGTLRIVEGDFYTLELSGPFDAICYWDGFGVGTDEQQQRLLKRIAGWLSVSGIVLLDVYTPWYWAKVAGRQMDAPTFTRRYGFDADGCRMLDDWWPAGRPAERVTQSLRCYSPQDLRLLTAGAGLAVVEVVAGGAVDYEAGAYLPSVPLEHAMQYRAVLRHDAAA
jgi:SAM-dependent methyltransferase